MQSLKNKEFTSQTVSPPVVINVTPREEEVLHERMDELEKIGFRIEPFGERTYALTGTPANLYSIAEERLLREMLDEAADLNTRASNPEPVLEKIASLSCKAAIKGGWHTTDAEREALVREVLTRRDIKYCPHGRPVCITLTQRQLEKQFKRV